MTAHCFSWLKYLPSSFWLDECGTAWLVQGGFSDVLRRSLLLLHAPLFALIAASAAAIGGINEIALRLPSWLAAGLSIFLLRKLAFELSEDATIADAAAGVFTLWPMLSFAASDARPYALALAAVCAMHLSFVRAVRRGNTAAFVALVLSATAVVYLQLLFVYVLAFPAGFLILFGRESLRRSRTKWTIAGLAILVLLCPLAAHYRVMFEWGTRYSFAQESVPAFLLDTLTPRRPVFFFALMLIPAAPFILQVRFNLTRQDRYLLPFSVLASAVPVAALVAGSTLTGASLYVPRYFTPAIPGMALLAGWIIGRINPSNIRAWITIGALTVTLGLQWGIAEWHHAQEDWRGAMARAATLSAGKDSALVVYSGFGESGSLQSLRSADHRSYLLAPLAAYPASASKIVTLPFKTDPPSLQFWDDEFKRSINGAQSFTVVARGMFFYDDWRDHLAHFATSHCYHLAFEEHYGKGPYIKLAHFVRESARPCRQ